MKEKTLYDIFSIAIEKEREAQKLYDQAAKLSGNNELLRKRFIRFRNDEKKHEEALIKDYAEFKKIIREKDKGKSPSNKKGQ
jgi:rubrerythrin